MITDEEVYSYLEHHGVKGMRWGTRKGGGGSTRTRHPRTAAENAKRAETFKRRAKLGADIAIGVVGGALFVSRIMQRHANVKMSDIPPVSDRTVEYIGNISHIPYKSIPIPQLALPRGR